ncbi:hypothetical protein L1049_024394 [Liquidambar formosana]|uniref:Uncharacterized protein n=1 Tax=Liquidambar formosana TaxID=63359 RepID=A0AAP0X185_LIQFO
MKVKPSSKDGKKEKLSISAMLASMGQKPDKPRKASSSGRPKTTPAQKLPSYTDGIDLPSSDDDDDDEYASEEEQQHSEVQKRSNQQQQRSDLKPLDVSITGKELKKREKKDLLLPKLLSRPSGRLLKMTTMLLLLLLLAELQSWLVKPKLMLMSKI